MSDLSDADKIKLDALTKRAIEATRYPLPNSKNKVLNGTYTIHLGAHKGDKLYIALVMDPTKLEGNREFAPAFEQFTDKINGNNLWRISAEGSVPYIEAQLRDNIHAEPPGIVLRASTMEEMEGLVGKLEKQAPACRQFLTNYYLTDEPLHVLFANSRLLTDTMKANAGMNLAALKEAVSKEKPDGADLAALIEPMQEPLKLKTVGNYLDHFLQQEQKGNASEKAAATKILDDFVRYVPLFTDYVAQHRQKPALGDWTADALVKQPRQID